MFIDIQHKVPVVAFHRKPRISLSGMQENPIIHTLIRPVGWIKTNVLPIHLLYRKSRNSVVNSWELTPLRRHKRRQLSIWLTLTWLLNGDSYVKINR